jgi:hypothetical protein
MLYGWIEIGASNDTLFANEVPQDIIVRTIYDNKIILGNTDGVRANAAVYILGNNIGVRKVPQSNVALDVDGLAVFKSGQVGLSNTPTSLIVNGNFVLKDQSKNFLNDMELKVVNDLNTTTVLYNNIRRLKITDGLGMEINDNLTVTQEVFAQAFQITSDKRLKSDIKESDVTEDVETFRSLGVKDYVFTASPHRPIKGFIAQEVESVFPQAVKEHQPDQMKTVDTYQLLALNTSVLQDVLRRLDNLEKFVYNNNK